jgi:hypothetical protein
VRRPSITKPLVGITGKWLRIEGVRGSNPLSSTQVKGHFHDRKWPF